MSSGRMLIYNLFPTLAGTFPDWDTHIRRASEMGFNWVFVNPVQLTGISGSLYSIKDYMTINPLLSDESSGLSPADQLRDTIRRAGDMGVSIMIDLVINHSAIDSPLTARHPEWYKHDDRGRIEHPFAMDGRRKVVWGDLARFDHEGTSDPEGLYNYFRSVTETLAGWGFRGFRCDAAYQIPQKIWRRLISDIKGSYPETVFAAETLGCSREQTIETAGAGFDYIFNSSKWWDFSSPWLMEQYDMFRTICRSISFPESHDTERVAEEFEGDINAMKRAYLFSAFFSSGVMIPMGFEFGFRKRLHVVYTRPSDWEDTGMDIISFISEVNKIKSSIGAFNSEVPTEVRLAGSNGNILIMDKQADTGVVTMVLNLDLKNSHHVPEAILEEVYSRNSRPTVCVSPPSGEEALAAEAGYTLGPGDGIIFHIKGN